MTKRNSTLEFFRVMLMLMVITLHYLYTGGVLEELNIGNKNYLITWVIEALCLVSVNCFVMLSAWFLSQKGAGWKKALSIFLEVLFYSWGIYFVLCLLGYQQFNLMTLVTRYLFPISSGYDWFATVYVVYVLMTPFLNRLGENLNRREFGVFVLILFIAFSAIPTVLFFSIDNLGIVGGYSLLWFVFLHYLTMYIRRFSIRFSKRKSLAVYLGSSAVSLLVKLSQEMLVGREYWNLYKYNSITTLVGSMALFMCFLQFPERHSKFWTMLGSTTFGVLLIHTQYTIRTEILWDKIVKPLDYIQMDIYKYIIHIIGSVIAIFVICSLIDFARQIVFKTLSNKLEKLRNRNNYRVK